LTEVNRQKKNYEKIIFEKEQEIENHKKDFENEKGIF